MNQTMPQGRLAIFRINYKSDFIITLNSDAGWMTPFCIKFWTGAPSQAYFAGWDGTTYTNCAPVDGDPTKLKVQFDDHHLPIGELMYQIGYHFTVADFPTTVEDEVLNQERVVISHDGQDEKVLLDFNGETAPEIEFSLPAYANESQRIANEEQRIAHEAIRIVNEESRIAAETIRQQNEEQRIQHEEYRVSEFARLKSESEAATTASNDAASLANEKAALAANKAALAQAAATLANEKAQLAADKAALAAAAATLANDKAALAQQKAAYAQEQGDYAKAQGDYAKEQGDTAQADHERAEADHTTAADDHQTAAADHTTAASDHSRAEADHTTAASDHSRAEGDHATAAADHTTAASDHTRAESDHTTAAADHETAASDHTRAESDHAAVEVYVDSLGAFDISAYNATGGVLAKYADLTAALGTDGANIPEAIRKGGMSVKFVQSSDNKYIQFRCKTQSFSADPEDWYFDGDETLIENPEYIEAKTDSEGKLLAARKPDGTKIEFCGLEVQGDIINKGLANKVDKEEGKGLSTNDYNNEAKEIVDSNSLVDNPEWSKVDVDTENKILGGRKKDGSLVENTDTTINAHLEVNDGLDVKGNVVTDNFANTQKESLEFIKAEIDKEGKILEGIRKNGKKYFPAGIESPEINKINRRLDDIYIEEDISRTIYRLKAARYFPYSQVIPLTLFHFSDIHEDKLAFNRYVEDRKKYGLLVDDIICTGDMREGDAGEIESWWDPSVLTCIGNHDVGKNIGGVYTWDGATVAERTQLYIEPFESHWGNIVHPTGKPYYYKDYPNSKVRLIVLDITLYDDEIGSAEIPIQEAWLSDVMDDAKENEYHVIIAVHGPYAGGIAVPSQFTYYGADVCRPSACTNIPDAIIDIVAAKITAGCKFICYICGHRHIDAIWDAKGDKTQFIFNIDAGCKGQPKWNGADLYRAEEGYSFAYNLMTIDTHLRLIKLIRGGGATLDVYMRPREYMCFNYRNGEIIE